MLYRSLRLGLAALAGLALLAPTAASAQYRDYPPARHERAGRGWGDRGYAPPPGYRQNAYDYDRAGYGRDYQARPDRRGRPPARDYRGGRGRRCDRGDGGTILGAIAGGLLGNAAAGRGDRGVGTVVGAGVGALTGRAIDRDC